MKSCKFLFICSAALGVTLWSAMIALRPDGSLRALESHPPAKAGAPAAWSPVGDRSEVPPALQARTPPGPPPKAR